MRLPYGIVAFEFDLPIDCSFKTYARFTPIVYCCYLYHTDPKSLLLSIRINQFDNFWLSIALMQEMESIHEYLKDSSCK